MTEIYYYTLSLMRGYGKIFSFPRTFVDYVLAQQKEMAQ